MTNAKAAFAQPASVARFVGAALLCVVCAATASAQVPQGLTGTWFGEDGKAYEIKVTGNQVELHRPVAKALGGTRIYVGTYAPGRFLVIRRPRSIGEINHRIPAPIRRELLRRGTAYKANIILPDGAEKVGGRIQVQFLVIDVTWNPGNPNRIKRLRPDLPKKPTNLFRDKLKEIQFVSDERTPRAIKNVNVGEPFRVKLVFNYRPAADRQPVALSTTPTGDVLKVIARRWYGSPKIFMTDPITIRDPDAGKTCPPGVEC
jgi:hypothetical protein